MWKLFLIASLAAVALSDSYLYPHSQTYLLSKEEVDNINNLAKPLNVVRLIDVKLFPVNSKYCKLVKLLKAWGSIATSWL